MKYCEVLNEFIGYYECDKCLLWELCTQPEEVKMPKKFWLALISLIVVLISSLIWIWV